MGSPADVASAMREQSGWCERLGSPFYRALLSRIADDVQASGACWGVLEPRAADPARFKLPLRFLAAIHRLVLEGKLPDLARHYPSAGAAGDAEAAWSVLARHGDQILAAMPETVQTSEVRRCCALLPGFLEIARDSCLPLRLLEIGSSAGLNLRWDHYRYESCFGGWGPADSPLIFDNAFTGHRPLLDTEVEVLEWRGCDLNPIDPLSAEGALRLLSFLWPDQPDRFDRLAGAIEVARRTPAVVERADAVEWLEAQLAAPRPGMATVVFHSIVLPYIAPEARARMTKILKTAGEQATSDAPLAWLSMEPNGHEDDVCLTVWPGGARRAIAMAGYHGGRAVVLNAACSSRFKVIR
jgi:hypothetical protein